jgi:AcrR family transcriptional regulator
MADRISRQKQTAEKRRRQILQAGITLFSQKGYEGATIPGIAALAGLAPGTIYLYYAGKRELFVAVIEELIVSPLADIFKDNSSADFPATLRNVLANRLNMLESDITKNLVSLMSEIQRQPELRELFVERLIHPFLSRMAKLYQTKMDAGEFRRFDSTLIVRAIGGMIIGLTILKSLEGAESPLSRMQRDRVVAELADFIFFGVSNARKETESTLEEAE